MRAFHHAPADIQLRADNLVHSQGFNTYRCTNNVDNGIDRSHFVKMDGLNWNIVNLGLSRTQSLEDTNRRSFGGFRDLSCRDDLPYLGQSTMRMLMPMPMLVHIFAVRLLMRVRMAMVRM